MDLVLSHFNLCFKNVAIVKAIAHPWMLESITDSKKFKDVARQVAAIDGWEVPF